VKRQRWLDPGLAGLIACLGLAIYWTTFGLNFFWEDPFDIGQVDGRSFVQLLTQPNSNSYYRPVTLLILSAIRNSSWGQSAFAFHLPIIGFHLVAVVLLYCTTLYWFRNRMVAFSTALIFLIYPIAYEATARAISPHSLLLTLALAAAWLYTLGREKQRPLLIALSFLLSILAVFVHENGILLPALIIPLEWYLARQGRLPRFQWSVFWFALPAVAFVILWLLIPKPVGPPQLGPHLTEALYLSQGLSFPVARLISGAGGFGLSADWQAILALIGTLAVLVVLYGRAGWLVLGLALLWWVAGSSLAWAARTIDYLEVAPRVMYFPGFAAALAWGGLVGQGAVVWRRWLNWAVVGLVAIQSFLTLHQVINLYQAGSTLMDQIVSVGRIADRLLYINVPDRFEYRQPLYPVGYWGMLLAPVSQDLSGFVHLASGHTMQTESLSDFPLRAAMVDASPYAINTRGSDAHNTSELYDKILWANQTYWTDYAPSGAMTLRQVGDISPQVPSVPKLGTIAQAADLFPVEAGWQAGSPVITLHWQAYGLFRPTDTIFVHLFDRDGNLVGQGDGDSLNGLVPPSAWRAGDAVTDPHLIVTDGTLPPGDYHVTVGVYDRATGQRYPVFDAHGQPVADDELEVATVTQP